MEDEVEEAAHSDELAEGRLENRGRAEMVRAINFMSRAEAQLNDGRAKRRCAFERQALASLERALDRRRYFLRTLPDRSRIDTTRRLTGDRREARSWVRDRAASAAPVVDANDSADVMRELVSAAAGTVVGRRVAGRARGRDRSGVTGVAEGRGRDRHGTQRRGAERCDSAAMQAVTTHALKTLPAAAVVQCRQTHSPDASPRA